jgi:4'-phosphopantetheinyl transferase
MLSRPESVEVFWLDRTAADVPPGDDWLTDFEREIQSRLRNPKRLSDWRLGRWTAKSAVAARLRRLGVSTAPTEIELRPAESGAPRVFVRGRDGTFVASLSHSHGVGFCTVADTGAVLGCDIEMVERRGAAFLTDYFTVREQESALQSAEDCRDQLVTVFWSAKESALKACETGLRADLRSVEIRRLGLEDSGSGWRSLEVAVQTQGTLRGWWRATGGVVWTVVAAPAPLPPTALERAATVELTN